jgi:hypothetical protein
LQEYLYCYSWHYNKAELQWRIIESPKMINN